MIDATPYIAKMVSPRDKRNVWNGGVLQVNLGRACTLSCTHCSQGSNLTGKTYFMTADQFEVACKSLEGYFGVVGLFGGMPTLNREFPEICEIMRKYTPWQRRGLWTHDLNGHGTLCAKIFNPAVSNLNLHQSKEAEAEFISDWPESIPYLKGLDSDSRHSPGLVAMQDIIPDERERWELISNCDINRRWSAMIYVFRGELRATFCEIAGAQSILHQHEPDYPDTGMAVTDGWWNQPIEAFEKQIRFHCHACGIPLRGVGDFANSGTTEQVSATHANIFKLKKPKGKTVQLVTKRSELGGEVSAATQYLPTEKS